MAVAIAVKHAFLLYTEPKKWWSTVWYRTGWVPSLQRWTKTHILNQNQNTWLLYTRRYTAQVQIREVRWFFYLYLTYRIQYIPRTSKFTTISRLLRLQVLNKILSLQHITLLTQQVQRLELVCRWLLCKKKGRLIHKSCSPPRNFEKN